MAPRPDIVIGDPYGAAVMVVEVKGRPIGKDLLASPEWRQLREAMERARAPYGLLFSPGKSMLVGPDGKVEEFEGQPILDEYKIQELPRFEPDSLAETVVYTWLVDLSLGIDRPSPSSFPKILGDDVRRAA